MTLRIPTAEILAKFSFSSVRTPIMTVMAYDIDYKILLTFEAPRNCQLEYLAAWMANDPNFIKYMYTIRGNKKIGQVKRSDFIVELHGPTEYVKFVGVYFIDNPAQASPRIHK